MVADPCSKTGTEVLNQIGNAASFLPPAAIEPAGRRWRLD
jgi:hypothetical protein